MYRKRIILYHEDLKIVVLEILGLLLFIEIQKYSFINHFYKYVIYVVFI